MTKIIAIIISYNGKNEILETIYALKNQVNKILVIDNNSDEESLKFLENLESQQVVSLIKLQQNYGIGYALNLGIKYAVDQEFHWILTMDQDSIANENMVAELLRCGYIDENIVSVTPSLALHNKINNQKYGFVDYAITSGNLVKTCIFKEVGLYNEEYFIDSVDFEFSLRLRSANFKIYRCKDAILNHSLGRLTSKRILGIDFDYISHSPIRSYYMIRNHLYLCHRYAHEFTFFIFKKNILLIIFFLQIVFIEDEKIMNLKMIYKGIRHYFMGKAGSLDSVAR